jgi:hypothetical protein
VRSATSRLVAADLRLTGADPRPWRRGMAATRRVRRRCRRDSTCAGRNVPALQALEAFRPMVLQGTGVAEIVHSKERRLAARRAGI